MTISSFNAWVVMFDLSSGEEITNILAPGSLVFIYLRPRRQDVATVLFFMYFYFHAAFDNRGPQRGAFHII